MAENSKIEWTDHTFNPWQGCQEVAPECDNCYAKALVERFGHDFAERRRTSVANWRTPVRWNKQHEAFFAVHGRRQRVFCASLADVFDNQAPDEWRRDLWDLIEETPNLDWLILTKRIGNVMRMARTIDWFAGRKNVWLGISVGTQETANRDIPKLISVPARVRFLSMEPLLEPVSVFNIDGPIDLPRGRPSPIHWVITGGESGPKARPSNPGWFRSLRDECIDAAVPFLFKQWGEWASPEVVSTELWSPEHTYVDGAYMMKVGKKAAGRTLDGRTWDGFPR